jgi:hypothetical protein
MVVVSISRESKPDYSSSPEGESTNEGHQQTRLSAQFDRILIGTGGGWKSSRGGLDLLPSWRGQRRILE